MDILTSNVFKMCCRPLKLEFFKGKGMKGEEEARKGGGGGRPSTISFTEQNLEVYLFHV